MLIVLCIFLKLSLISDLSTEMGNYIIAKAEKQSETLVIASFLAIITILILLIKRAIYRNFPQIIS